MEERRTNNTVYTIYTYNTSSEPLDCTFQAELSTDRQRSKNKLHFTRFAIQARVIDFLNFLCDCLKRIEIVDNAHLPGLVLLNGELVRDCSQGACGLDLVCI